MNRALGERRNARLGIVLPVRLYLVIRVGRVQVGAKGETVGDSRAESKTSTRRIRYAVVGLGHIAQRAVLPAFQAAQSTSELTALVSGDPQKLETLGHHYGVRRRFAYDAFDECLQHVDAVFVCTPNSEHETYAVRAARAGRHVLCEKPLAVTDAACQRILAAQRAHSVKLMTAYRLHFDPITLEVLEHVRSGRIGEPRFFTSAFSMRVTDGNIRTRPELGGGSVYDLGIYCINAARMLFDAGPERVSALSVPDGRPSSRGVDDTTAALLVFPGGRLASFTSSFAATDVSTYRIVGTDGYVHVDPAYEYAEPIRYTISDGTTTHTRTGPRGDQFAAELEYFSRCIIEDREPEPSGEEGAWDVRIINALYESARVGRPMELDPRHDGAPDASQSISLPPSAEPLIVNAQRPHQ